MGVPRYQKCIYHDDIVAMLSSRGAESLRANPKKIRLPEVEIMDCMVIARGFAIDRGMELSDGDCSRQNVSVGKLSGIGCSKFRREPLGSGTHALIGGEMASVGIGTSCKEGELAVDGETVVTSCQCGVEESSTAARLPPQAVPSGLGCMGAGMDESTVPKTAFA